MHERARSNGNAGSVTVRQSMHAVVHGEAASDVLYTHCAASRHHSFGPEGIRKLSRHGVRMVHLYTHVFSKAAPLLAWQLTALMLTIAADGNATAACTTQARAASARARPPLAFELRQQCDPQPSAAAHRQLSTSPPGNTGPGHVVRGTDGTAGPCTMYGEHQYGERVHIRQTRCA